MTALIMCKASCIGGLNLIIDKSVLLDLYTNMLSVQRRGIGVILTWSFIVVSVLYVVYTVGRSVLIGIF